MAFSLWATRRRCNASAHLCTRASAELVPQLGPVRYDGAAGGLRLARSESAIRRSSRLALRASALCSWALLANDQYACVRFDATAPCHCFAARAQRLSFTFYRTCRLVDEAHWL
jgi:hypothetical protein